VVARLHRAWPMRAEAFAAIAGLAVLLAAPAGYADGVFPEPRPDVPHAYALHLGLGFETLAGQDNVAYGWRGNVGASMTVGNGRVRPMIGGGLVLAGGRIGGIGSDSPSYGSHGVELQLGLRHVQHREADTRLFVSLGYLRMTERAGDTMTAARSIEVGESLSGTALRIAIGGSWIRPLARALTGDDDSDTRLGAAGLALVLLSQAQIAWVHSAEANYLGVMLGVGI
jgi:hypothetical protein